MNGQHVPPTDAALRGVDILPELIATGEMVFLSSEAPVDDGDFEAWLGSANFRGHVSADGQLSSIIVGDTDTSLVDISERVYTVLGA